MRYVIVVKGKRTEFTNVLTAVSKTAAASVSYLKAANGTLVASDLDNLNNVGVIPISAKRKLYSLAENCSFLVYTATHGGLFAGNELCGYVEEVLKKLILPRESGYLAQNLIL